MQTRILITALGASYRRVRDALDVAQATPEDVALLKADYGLTDQWGTPAEHGCWVDQSGEQAAQRTIRMAHWLGEVLRGASVPYDAIIIIVED